jgi:xanthine dehydrogenase accessory factor
MLRESSVWLRGRMASPENTVLIKGAGEIGSGIAHRLSRCHFRVCLTETTSPLAVCRGTAFSEAVFDGIKTIEWVTAELVPASQIYGVWSRGNIPLVVDPDASVREQLRPDVVVDAIMAKRNTGTRITDAPLVIGLGPGFCAGRDVHVMVETSNSPNLGKVILEGESEPNTGTPVAIGGLTTERVVWAPQAGVFTSRREIGDRVVANQTIAWVDDLPLVAPISGILRGLLRSGVRVAEGDKLIEVDPVNDRHICDAIRDKVRVVADGVLEAIMSRQSGLCVERTTC